VISAEQRDKAVAAVAACLRKNEVSSRECRKLDEKLKTLVDVYNTGDKSVLPLLFKFTYLGDFYDEALLSDPDGFLEAMNRLPDSDRTAVARGLAGGEFRPLSKTRVEAIRNVLKAIPNESTLFPVASLCLKRVETNNAAVLLDYFPPRTFNDRAAQFRVYWYSQSLYSLGEKPLLPATLTDTVYRFTYIGAFTGPKSVKLTLLPDGTGQLQVDTLKNPEDPATLISKTKAVSADDVRTFLDKLAEAHYWEMPTEYQQFGVDGAGWILEAVQKGQYHIVDRWCPGLYDKTPDREQQVKFANAAGFLMELAGFKPGEC